MAVMLTLRREESFKITIKIQVIDIYNTNLVCNVDIGSKTYCCLATTRNSSMFQFDTKGNGNEY